MPCVGSPGHQLTTSRVLYSGGTGERLDWGGSWVFSFPGWSDPWDNISSASIRCYPVTLPTGGTCIWGRGSPGIIALSSGSLTIRGPSTLPVNRSWFLGWHLRNRGQEEGGGPVWWTGVRRRLGSSRSNRRSKQGVQ
jgi:hypothetical protein